MEQLNRIELKGNVGNVRLSDTTTGKKMARFSLATNYLFKTRDGDAGVETTWHNVVAFESRNIQHLDRIEKGVSVYAVGRVRSTKFTGQDGVERQSYEVVASKVTILDDDPES